MKFVVVSHGYYVLQTGDDAQQVAHNLYGDVHKSNVLLEANKNTEWTPGNTIVVPNKKGRQSVYKDGESPQQVIERLFPGQPVHLYLNRYFLWNGGHEFPPKSGDFVYVPER